jgi:hypothetical protein
MEKVIEITVLENYYIWLKFADGEERTINFRPLIGKGFTKELLHYEKFIKVFIEPGGGIAWENGYDFCPNYLKELKDEKQIAV